MPNEFSVRLVPAKMAGVVSPKGGGYSHFVPKVHCSREGAFIFQVFFTSTFYWKTLVAPSGRFLIQPSFQKTRGVLSICSLAFRVCGDGLCLHDKGVGCWGLGMDNTGYIYISPIVIAFVVVVDESEMYIPNESTDACMVLVMYFTKIQKQK